MTLEPETWQFNTDLGLFLLSELHCMSLVNNLSFVAFLRKFKRMCKESESCLVMSDSLPPHGLYSPWNSPGQNTGVGSLSLLQGIFPTQGLNPGLLHSRWILYQLSHEGSPSTRMGSLSLLLWIFPIQESNQDLLHCRFFTS